MRIDTKMFSDTIKAKMMFIISAHSWFIKDVVADRTMKNFVDICSSWARENLKSTGSRILVTFLNMFAVNLTYSASKMLKAMKNCCSTQPSQILSFISLNGDLDSFCGKTIVSIWHHGLRTPTLETLKTGCLDELQISNDEDAFSVTNRYAATMRNIEKPFHASLNEDAVYKSIFTDRMLYEAIGMQACICVDIALAKGGTEAVVESYYSVISSDKMSGGQNNETLALRSILTSFSHFISGFPL